MIQERNGGGEPSVKVHKFQTETLPQDSGHRRGPPLELKQSNNCPMKNFSSAAPVSRREFLGRVSAGTPMDPMDVSVPSCLWRLCAFSMLSLRSHRYPAHRRLLPEDVRDVVRWHEF